MAPSHLPQIVLSITALSDLAPHLFDDFLIDGRSSLFMDDRDLFLRAYAV
jgi:hypothetical protein